MKRRWNLRVLIGLLVILLAFWGHSWAQLPRLGVPPPLTKGGPRVGQKAPHFTLPDKYGSPMRLSELLAASPAGENDKERKDPWVLLVFYRGYWCPSCNADLRSLQKRQDEFTARGVRIVAVSSDPPDVTRNYADKQGFTFTFLSDAGTEVIREYDLLREGSGSRRADVARPAQFLIDSGGVFRWVNLSEDMSVRVSPEDILKVIDELSVVSSSARN